MLGFNTEYLKSTGLFPKNSYEILKIICNDPFRLYNMVIRGNLSYDCFISDYAEDKMNGFTNICGANICDMEFICKYSKEYSYITGNPQLEADYYIGYRLANVLHVLGLIKNGEYYYPMTNRYIGFEDEEEMEFLKQLLENQVITMPVSSEIYFRKTDTSSNKIYLFDQKKPQKIKTLKEYAKTYKATVDVSSGYAYVVEKLLKQFNSSNTKIPLLNKVFESVVERLLVNIGECEREFGVIPEDILELINKYNQSLLKDISAALDKHTRTVEEDNAYLMSENQKHLQELQELKRQLLETKNTIAILEQQNLEYKSREEETIEVMKKIYRL